MSSDAATVDADKLARKAARKAEKAALALAASLAQSEGPADEAAEDELPDAATGALAIDADDEERRAARKAARKAEKRALKVARRAQQADGDAAEEEEEVNPEADSGAAAAPPPPAKSAKRPRLNDEAASVPSVITHASSSSAAAPAPPADPRSQRELRKMFYVQSDAVNDMTPGAVAAFRAERSIAVEDAFSSSDWRPITQFAHTGGNFSKDMMAATTKFTTPSPVQAQCWPIQLSGRDIIGIAATGSGKTLAFLLPSFVHIKAQAPLSAKPGCSGPIVLVVAPTRELAMQTAAVAEEAGKLCGVKSVCIYGGVPKDEQRRVLRAGGGVHVVVATPGRLLDLMEEGAVSLDRVTYLVLDEADRMLDMGFEKDIRTIVGKLRKDRQTTMFSATWPVSIQSIAAEFLVKPVRVVIGSVELAASSSVKQIVEVLDEHARDSALMKLLSSYHSSRKNRVLVFVLYKKEAARMEKFLQSRGWNCSAIHGDMSQDARTRAFINFKDGKIPLLIATDVAARGLDIPNVEYVINYSFPLTIEDYVHRIGRTGRGGATGIAHTFFTQLDKTHAGELQNVLREGGHAVPAELLKFGSHIKKKEHALYGAHYKAAAGPAVAPTMMKFGDDE